MRAAARAAPELLFFRVLGPLEVVRDGRRIRLVGKPAALLVDLLLRRNEVVPAERLVDDLWDEPLPRSAPKLLQAHVSQLRKVLGRDRVRTVAAGYLLAAETEELDLGVFERLLREARGAEPAEALGLLQEALSLWRGPALADAREEPFARNAAHRLEELRLHALEARFDAALAVGGRHELVPELETLVADNPLRERLRGQLMLALYRSGRQADALARYREGRRVLVDTLGLDPAPELRRLEEAILRHDPALDGLQAPSSGGSFVLVGDDERAEGLFAPIARARGRELLLVRLVEDVDALAQATEALAARRARLMGKGLSARVVSFRSGAPAADLARLANRPGVELLVLEVAPDGLRELGPLAPLLRGAACDVVFLAGGGPRNGSGPVVVAFGGGDHEWAALELGAALAETHETELVLVGGRRKDTDASRALAAASLAVQAGTGIVARPLILPTGADALGREAAGATALLIGLPDDWRRRGLGEARAALIASAPAPTLLVRRGLRVPGLETEESVTRFTWS